MENLKDLAKSAVNGEEQRRVFTMGFRSGVCGVVRNHLSLQKSLKQNNHQMDVLPNMEERYLRYDFSAVETHELALKLANKTQEASAIAEEKKAIVSQYKSKEDQLKSELESLSNKVASGYEMRKVECEIKYHFPEQGKKTFIRKDTGEANSEKMTSEEWNLFNQAD